ncbi:MAG: VWA domain-containing protein [Gammaproteobacteria bacterium]|nr:VWA domain-containing protein [Gammaproteobacteria bacterium]
MSALLDFHFLRPLWLLTLLPLLAGAWLLLRQRLQAGRWRHAVDPELARWVIESGWRGTLRRGLFAVLLAWTLAVLALAGPSFEKRPQPVARGADALVVVLDLSLSMYAQDLSPSRLARARLKIADILELRKDGRTGLVVHAGDAHTVVPLTDDVRTIRNLLPALEPGLMPILGSRTAPALDRAGTLLEDAAAPDGRILLITDEVTDPEAAIRAAGNGHPVSVLGMGTAEGAPIPLEPIGRSGHLRDDGRTVIVHLDEAPLRRLAAATGGRYASFSRDDADLRHLLGGDSRTLRPDDDRDREFDLWIDLGPWLVLLVLPVALLAFRRGLVAVLALMLLVPVQETRAAAPGDWFARPDQRAYEALRSGNPDEAASTFEDPEWRATALYRAGEYAEAARTWSAGDADALYNRGTALARAGEFEAAQQTLAAALEQDPGHADALHNKKIVDRLLEKRRQDAANEEGSSQEDPNGSEGNRSESQQRADQSSQSRSGEDEPGEQQPGQGESGDAQQRDAEGRSAEAGDEEGERGSDEQRMAQRSRERAQALEQWLRRIPDEPGALLRRKFQYESDQRQRRGLRRAPEEDPPW